MLAFRVGIISCNAVRSRLVEYLQGFHVSTYVEGVRVDEWSMIGVAAAGFAVPDDAGERRLHTSGESSK